VVRGSIPVGSADHGHQPPEKSKKSRRRWDRCRDWLFSRRRTDGRPRRHLDWRFLSTACRAGRSKRPDSPAASPNRGQL